MCISPKDFTKITAAPKTAVMADSRDRPLAFCQHLTGGLQTVSHYILYGCHMQTVMIDSCICLYFSPQFHMLHTERCSARRKTGCHHPWKLRFLWLCSHGLRYTGRPVYSSYSFHTSYLFSFLPCLVSTGGAVPVDAFSGVSAIRHSPPHHNPGCALHHILAPQCPNHIQ